jgi:hypothetical protein
LGCDVISTEKMTTPITWMFNKHNIPAPVLSDACTLSKIRPNPHRYRPLYNTVITVEAHKAEAGVTQCCQSQQFGHIWSRDRWVGITMGYGLDAQGSRVRFPARAENFSLKNRVLNGSGAHPASYPMGTRGYFPGGKEAGAWSSPLTSI